MDGAEEETFISPGNGHDVRFRNGIIAAQQLRPPPPADVTKTHLDSVSHRERTPSFQIKSFSAYKTESTTTSRAACNIHCS